MKTYILIYSENLHFDLARRRLCYLEDSCGTQFPRSGRPYKCFLSSLNFFLQLFIFFKKNSQPHALYFKKKKKWGCHISGTKRAIRDQTNLIFNDILKIIFFHFKNNKVLVYFHFFIYVFCMWRVCGGHLVRLISLRYFWLKTWESVKTFSFKDFQNFIHSFSAHCQNPKDLNIKYWVQSIIIRIVCGPQYRLHIIKWHIFLKGDACKTVQYIHTSYLSFLLHKQDFENSTLSLSTLSYCLSCPCPPCPRASALVHHLRCIRSSSSNLVNHLWCISSGASAQVDTLHSSSSNLVNHLWCISSGASTLVHQLLCISSGASALVHQL